MKKIVVVFLMLLSLVMIPQEKTVFFYHKGENTPVIYMPKFSSTLTKSLGTFQKKIHEKSGLRIPFSSQKKTEVFNVYFKEVKSLNSATGYNIVLKGKVLEIVAATENGFESAVDFLINKIFVYTSEKDIKIPSELFVSNADTKEAAFEYREVYFSQNFDPKNRSFYHTNYLETEWGLWGHNIRKWVKKEKVSDEIYALQNGKRNPDQLCFSSEDLKKIIHKNVKESQINDVSLKRFMIAPDDNNIVCQCHLCKDKGNTKSNASPAVYSLLSEFAKKYTDLTFWSLGYVTTKTPPSFKLPSNVGVLLSTIDCQEALPLEETSKGKQFLNQIATWNSKIENIYIWDYVVNFDNYMDFYPLYTTTQKNLKAYIKNGVTGVFLHGSGYDYSIVEEVKYHVLSKLLENPNDNVERLITEAVDRYYPELPFLSSYLITAEAKAIQSQKKQNIYSGIKLANKRYLAFDDLENLYNQADKISSQKIDKFKIGLLFLQLEMMHVNGLKNEGFGVLDENDIVPLETIPSKLEKLANLVKSTGLNTINEKNGDFNDYILQWSQFLSRIQNNNSFYNVNISTFSKLDEDYKNIKVLNDGAFGFDNYNDNWLIFSGKELLLNVNNTKCPGKKITKIEIGFLSDTRHRIFLPSVIQILDKENKLIKEIVLKPKNTEKSTVEIMEFELPNLTEHFSYNIKLINPNKSIAIDELRFLR
ncbi:DUF4838 domain-containing protein [Wenyingzhuangia sp. 1_MG-2023]|nr:DUF4838 domain-containing protein [Wenyingzhuangia sp. 1_MG-2023]